MRKTSQSETLAAAAVQPCPQFGLPAHAVSGGNHLPRSPDSGGPFRTGGPDPDRRRDVRRHPGRRCARVLSRSDGARRRSSSTLISRAPSCRRSERDTDFAARVCQFPSVRTRVPFRLDRSATWISPPAPSTSSRCSRDTVEWFSRMSASRSPSDDQHAVFLHFCPDLLAANRHSPPPARSESPSSRRRPWYGFRRCPLTKVPCVEPRSSTNRRPLSRLTRK